MEGILLLLVILPLTLLVTRVAAVALTLTGLSPDVAKFQARSALSSTGLGTHEAEQIVGHPARRKIYSALMLLGNAGLVTAIASLSQSLSTFQDFGDSLTGFGLLVAALVLLLILSRNRRFEILVAQVAERVLRRYTKLDVGDYAGLLHVGMNYGVNRIKIKPAHWLAGQTLADSRLTDEGMLVLGVERSQGTYLGAPRGDVAIEVGDQVLVYGPTGPLDDLHNRPQGPAGDQEHEDQVVASQTREAFERSRDSSRLLRRFRRHGHGE